ncbi:Hypothetical predicted protein [Paramuricea clavata]|uniref:Uncharacterized protein n=1 Tax=Paramuricea clavata TaxID=317549 RepID=A0A6S7FP77_PARCT|nr:Hypothetical predicted protein [Paramuricea clavata]
MAEEIEVQNQEETAGIDEEQATINEKQLEEHIMNLKGEKRSAKSRMTRLLNNMAAMLSNSNTEQKDVKELLLRIDEQKDETLHIMNQLEDIYQRSKEYENAKKVNDEADALVDQVEYETSSARMFLTSLAKKQWSSSAVTVTSSKESNVGETSKQRQDGDERRKNAELWARMRNEAEVQKKRELLEEQEKQLRTAEEQAEKKRQELVVLEKGNNEDNENQQNSEQSNTVERIEVNETPMRTAQISLPANSNTPTRGAGATTSQAQLERIRIPVFSGVEAAKARLVRKYGGSRRQVQSHLDELKKLRPLEENNPKELEKFADILERAVITLKENGRESDLESGTLRTIILGEIPERLLAQYYRWVKENHYKDSLEKLKDWVAEEAEYQMQASEIKNGINSDGERRKERRYRSFFNKESDKKEYDPCSACAGSHPIWKCDSFRNQAIDEKWKIARRVGLCYRCLGKDHLGSSCTRSRQCNINGCKETHHRLLHGQRRVNTKGPNQDSNVTEKPPMKQMVPEKKNLQEQALGMEGDGNTQATTMKTSTAHDTKKIALRTIPVILKSGTRKVYVNCLLDEGSDTTYINEDVIEELGLTGVKEKIEVKVANDQTISFMSNTFTIGLESMDGRVDTEIVAKTSGKICGGNESC